MKKTRISVVKAPCHWVKEGNARYLTPGCINRAINGDFADCHCFETGEDDHDEQSETMMDVLKRIEAKVDNLQDVLIAYSSGLIKP